MTLIKSRSLLQRIRSKQLFGDEIHKAELQQS